MTVHKLNGTQIDPAEFRYLPRKPLDVQGDGRPLYPAVRSAEWKWNITTYAEWAYLQVQFDKTKSSGANVVQIPAFPTGISQDYSFTEYSGVYVSEPISGTQFADHPTEIILVISNIPV